MGNNGNTPNDLEIITEEFLKLAGAELFVESSNYKIYKLGCTHYEFERKDYIYVLNRTWRENEV